MNHSILPEQLLGQLHWRYPTKQFDAARRIEPQLWSALENALVLSPSSGGFQPWTFVVVDDLAKTGKRLPASFGQSQVTFKTYHGTHRGDFLGLAPLGRAIIRIISAARLNSAWRIRAKPIGRWHLPQTRTTYEAPHLSET